MATLIASRCVVSHISTSTDCSITHSVHRTWPTLTSICLQAEGVHEWTVDDEDVIHTASVWLKDQDQEFFYDGIQALRKLTLGQVHFYWS